MFQSTPQCSVYLLVLGHVFIHTDTHLKIRDDVIIQNVLIVECKLVFKSEF